VTLTGVGTVVLSASQAASGNYATATATVSFTVTGQIPTLAFAAIAPQIYGSAPFGVSASSASRGVVTYAVLSGPATISGNVVTLTGVGTVVLSAGQAASGNYAMATATTSFVVVSGFTISTGGNLSSVSIFPGGAAVYSFTIGHAGATYPDALNFSATGLPPGATATFSPTMISADSPVTQLTLTIQTSNNSQTARNEQPLSGIPLVSGVAFCILLLPLAGLRRARTWLRQIPRLSMVLFALSLGAVLALSGCGTSNGFFTQQVQSYTVTVIATDMRNGITASTNVILILQ
jgi:hypothetical protein